MKEVARYGGSEQLVSCVESECNPLYLLLM